jgi:hypothetical protein
MNICLPEKLLISTSLPWATFPELELIILIAVQSLWSWTRDMELVSIRSLELEKH